MIRAQTEHTERLKVLEFEYKKELFDDEKKKKVDAEIFSSIIELLEPQGVIAFLREHDFGGIFKLEDIAPLNSFINLSFAPNQEFLFTDLEKKRISKLLSIEEKENLISYLSEHPKAGDLIQGTGGIRKLRWTKGVKGKSSGIRVIYFFHSEIMPLYLLAVFGKNEKANITAEEKNPLSKAVKELVTYWGGKNEQSIH